MTSPVTPRPQPAGATLVSLWVWALSRLSLGLFYPNRDALQADLSEGSGLGALRETPAAGQGQPSAEHLPRV